MSRLVIICMLWLSAVLSGVVQARGAVVADSVSRKPLSGAAVSDCNGNVIGICNSRGRLPYIPAGCYPVTVRYMGFQEKTVTAEGPDTLFLRENFMELPEVVVESPRHKVMHILAYVREYSTLSTYTDTVSLFREKMVDYMLTPGRKMRFKGWSNPRILKCRSYYRFTDAHGLDSVSDVCSHHFSWSDWVGVVPAAEIPGALRIVDCGTDTLRGKYGPAVTWYKDNDRVMVDVDVLADTASRKWVPGLSAFFRKELDFENFRVRFDYDNVAGDTVSPLDLGGYSFNIESRGRGRGMFMFNRVNEPFFVSTYAEVYMLDKEYITVAEAKKWERYRFDNDEIDIYEPANAPELQPAVLALVDRVNAVDNDKVRQGLVPDRRLVGRQVVRQHFGQRVLQLFKDVTGISSYRSKKNWNNKWREFRKKRNDGSGERQ